MSVEFSHQALKTHSEPAQHPELPDSPANQPQQPEFRFAKKSNWQKVNLGRSPDHKARYRGPMFREGHWGGFYCFVLLPNQVLRGT